MPETNIFCSCLITEKITLEQFWDQYSIGLLKTVLQYLLGHIDFKNNVLHLGIISLRELENEQLAFQKETLSSIISSFSKCFCIIFFKLFGN